MIASDISWLPRIFLDLYWVFRILGILMMGFSFFELIIVNPILSYSEDCPWPVWWTGSLGNICIAISLFVISIFFKFVQYRLLGDVFSWSIVLGEFGGVVGFGLICYILSSIFLFAAWLRDGQKKPSV